MQNAESIFLPPVCSLHLEAINGIQFTRREIDIIACILGGRAAKKIGSFLSIAPKTVENHIRNIMLKLGCSSQENIIDFIEKSNKYLIIKNHYSCLLVHLHFEQRLKDLSLLIKNKMPIFIVYRKEKEDKASFISQLGKDLAIAGVKTTWEARERHAPSISLESQRVTSIYVLSDAVIEQFRTGDPILTTEISSFLQGATEKPPSVLFLLLNRNSLTVPQALLDANGIDLAAQENYYFLVFEIIKRLWPSSDLDKLIAGFKSYYKTIHHSAVTTVPAMESQFSKLSLTKMFLAYGRSHKVIISVAMFTAFCILVLALQGVEMESEQDTKLRLIRSDLSIPTEGALLNRPALLSIIDEKLQGNKGIETVALVGVIGVGGAGKTILARQFGRTQNKSLVRELNAETNNALYHSFKKLAYDLAKTNEQKQDLDLIQKIQNSEEKEKQLLSFLKARLKEYPNWLLIFDNVESLPEIKNYIPQDPKIWGSGKLIVTTRNGNIKNSGYVKPENIIQIGELTEAEALKLFCQIIYGTEPDKITQDQKEKALSFLKSIPPFPLDVSAAAYYIKSAGLTHEQYLSRIKEYSRQFEATQKNIMKEVNDYAKTRYGIITSSLERLINENPVYKEFMLFICLFDSQNIPRNLLESYGENSIIDRFIYDLRRNGMMTGEPSPENTQDSSSFSLHRSTQTLSLAFLLHQLSEAEKQNLLRKMVFTIVNFYESYRSVNDKQGASLKDLTFCYSQSLQSKDFKPKIVEISSQSLVSLIPHLEAFLLRLEEVDLSVDVKEIYKKDLLIVMGYIYYKCIKNLSLAKECFSKALAIEVKNQFFSNYPRAVLLKNLGVACSHLGDHDKALSYAQESLQLCEKIKNPEILAGKNLRTIGTVYYRRNDFKKSKDYFEAALDKIATVENDLKKYLESDLYEKLAILYSAKYINQEEAQQAEKYIHKSLEILDADHLFYNDTRIKKEKISWEIVRHKSRLGHIYSRMGKYREAFELGYREVDYIIKHNAPAFIPPVARARLDEGIGEFLLRTGDLNAAEKKLTDSINILEKLREEHDTEEYDTLYTRVFRTEARIRLKKLDEAYNDCNVIFKLKYNFVCSYRGLTNLTAFYHAAVIKYKQGDPQKSLEHFSDFFKNIHEFCQAFLSEQQYKNLKSKNVFAEVSSEKRTITATLSDCFRHSAEIFSEIYGNHPFVHDYVLLTYQDDYNASGELH